MSIISSKRTYIAYTVKVAEQFSQFVSICHLPDHGKRKVAAQKLKLGK